MLGTAENLITMSAKAGLRARTILWHNYESNCFGKRSFCMTRQTHLAALEQRHEALDKEIEKELVHPARDELKLSELKRRKLQLKDEIAKLRGEETSLGAR
jgi:hypothetical protein